MGAYHEVGQFGMVGEIEGLRRDKEKEAQIIAKNSTNLEAFLSAMGLADSLDMPMRHKTFQDEEQEESISMVVEHLYGFEFWSSFDNSMAVGTPLDRNSVNLVKAEGEEDLDLKSVDNVFWEELLNEHFDSQDDSGKKADANFIEQVKKDSSFSRSNVSLSAEKMGQAAFHQSIRIPLKLNHVGKTRRARRRDWPSLIAMLDDELNNQNYGNV